MFRLAIVAALISIPAFGQAAKYQWYNDTTDKNLIRLYRGSDAAGWELAGILDPEVGSWKWTPDGKPMDLIGASKRGSSGEFNEGTGELVYQGTPKTKGNFKQRTKTDIADPEYATRRKMIHDKVNERLKEAGLPPLPEKPEAKLPAEGKAGVAEDHPSIGDLHESRPSGQSRDDPVDGSPRKKSWMLNGVDGSKLSDTPRYQIHDRAGSREVGRAEALSAIEAGTVPDDAKLVRLTVIGGDAARKRVIADLGSSPALAWLKDRTVVNDYGSDHWRVRDGGFVTPQTADGVTIYAQMPDGKVIWRQDSYEGGADALARALRDRVPGYDPSKDPSPKRPDLSPSPGPSLPGGINPWWLIVPAGGFAAWTLAGRKKVPNAANT